MDGIEAEREPTNLVSGVRAWVMSHILIMEGLMDFSETEGEDVPSSSIGRVSREWTAPENHPTSSVAV